jgi:hypothetical protein
MGGEALDDLSLERKPVDTTHLDVEEAIASGAAPLLGEEKCRGEETIK